ncbi:MULTISPECIES: STM4504/CBY_0614 family protein [Rhizobium]|uniref:Abortive infection protein-like C-terminal domain-containing protein n=1 Tax=Rhizobium paranaense TaxID=1650438 RepID=A0A7W8XT26_9HYPH|nr:MULTISPECIES: hypothetical protein [Rhizobium]MBB5575068.1 hypothetical protein [Rhizobium paranaense]PST64496.1 hypothetical protein C9E91_03165 [Rhizobium sp. SEMIA4064]
MAVWGLFSKRQSQLRGEVPDVYTYTSIPPKLRVQIVHIISEALGNPGERYQEPQVNETYKTIVEGLCREYGLFYLPPTNDRYGVSYGKELFDFLLRVENVEQCLDVVEISFRAVDLVARQRDYIHGSSGGQICDGAIEELNERFKENGVGYQFVDGEIIRVDSQLLHAEAVKPALNLLNTREYRGPHEEFINAYEHYKDGNNKEALVDCLKAFESTMKAICDKRRWAYDPKGGAKDLIAVMFDKGLVPSFWQTQLSSLRSLLESSVPTGRNKLAGHGQGSTPTEVPDEITAYMLHMTASTLVFLTTAERALP